MLIALAAMRPAAQERNAPVLPPPAGRAIDFMNDVKPILEASCARCHARGRTKGGFSIESRETVLKGGDNGPAIVPGSSEVSELIALVAGLDPENVMPQKGSRLTPQQIGILRAWIDQGAAWAPEVSFARAAPRNLEPRRPALPGADVSGGTPPRSAAATGGDTRDGERSAGGRRAATDANPVDRLLSPYYAAHAVPASARANDRVLIRRMYLDVTGQLPPADAVQPFVADRRSDKRTQLVKRLLADRVAYAEHWLTFWNDLLRNDYRGTGYIDGGRRQITRWLYTALVTNMPFDRFVSELVNPVPGSEGFSAGIVWRGVVNASQAPEMQAGQNIAQVFMGVNLKCASCHDSFVSDWQLADAYGMAGIYADQALAMVECDRPTGQTAPVKFLYPQVGTIDAAAPKTERLKQLARLLTGERNGRLSRTFVNRVWARLMGRALVEPVDDMERQAWHADLLDWLAEDFVSSGYDVQALLERILTSDAYQRIAVDMPERADAYTFQGPAIRRLTAEQFVDALSAVTGVWQDAPAGDFDFTIDATRRTPSSRGRWIAPPAASRPGQADRARRTDAGRYASAVFALTAVTGQGGGIGRADEQAAIPSHAAGGTWFARGAFSLHTLPATAHVLIGADRPYVLYVNGHEAAEQEAPAAAPLVDIRPHLQRGRNVLAVVVGAPPAAEPSGDASPVPSDRDALFAQVLTRARFARSAATETVAASNRGWRVSRSAEEGWEQSAFDDRRWGHAAEPRAAAAASPESRAAVARALATAGRFGRTRAALTVASPLTTALGRPSREQVVTSRATPATTLQALELLNGQTLSEAITRGAEALIEDGPRSPADLVDRLYLRAVGRHPTAAEARACQDMLGPRVQRAGVEDLLWSIAMLPEFQLVY
jgi:cytochrome c553